jgi:hypothetical protein
VANAAIASATLISLCVFNADSFLISVSLDRRIQTANYFSVLEQLVSDKERRLPTPAVAEGRQPP